MDWTRKPHWGRPRPGISGRGNRVRPFADLSILATRSASGLRDIRSGELRKGIRLRGRDSEHPAGPVVGDLDYAAGRSRPFTAHHVSGRAVLAACLANRRVAAFAD